MHDVSTTGCEGGRRASFGLWVCSGPNDHAGRVRVRPIVPKRVREPYWQVLCQLRAVRFLRGARCKWLQFNGTMNIANIRESDRDFHILETTGRTQTATMRLKSGETTSDRLEAHPHSDQTIVVLEGEFVAEVGEESGTLRMGQSLIIPAGVKHRFRNDGNNSALAFTVYAPPAYQTDDPT